ncbi:MAG: 50S ribosomal protein L11 methyltransferase [Anaerolineae bacterium]|nr:50S ribosomal protein L11 methyltransferase [Anaerolineae bacterium]
MEWLEVCVQTDPEAAEAVSEVLSRYTPQGIAIDLGDGSTTPTSVTVKAYLDVADDVEAQQRQVAEALWHLSCIWPAIQDPVFARVADQDWAAGWKETIPVLHIGSRVIIKPSWRDYMAQPGEMVLEMDPGMAFGTGLHPTTQLCVEALEVLSEPEMRVLDLGTGTGILALVAAKMGVAEVVAVDNDMNAVVACRRNACANELAHVIRPVHGSLEDISGTYHLVLANILAPVIIGMVEAGLATRVRAGGALVVSGILAEQADDVRVALENSGLQIAEQRQSGDWIALVARKLRGVPPHLAKARAT